MSRRGIVLLIIMVLLIPLWSFLVWLIRPVRPVNVLIMDKTVLTLKGQEHRSFNWILTHHKYSKPDGKLYKIKQDYHGFFPIERGKSYFTSDLDGFVDAVVDPATVDSTGRGWFTKVKKPGYSFDQIDSIASSLDMVYFTDMYGMYVNEWFRDTILWKERSPLLYGGLTENDLHLLEKMKEKKKLILAEFNYYHHPTDGSIRERAGQLLNIRWTGWIGRYFENLDPTENEELPMWVVTNYMNEHGGRWPFKKSGIVLAREDDWIEVLEDSTHLNVEIPYIYTTRYGQKKFRMIKKVHYPFWFDISLPTNDKNTIVSTFKIEPNSKGDSILRLYDIPAVFPAVMESTGPSPYYYFGADFCDNPIRNGTACFAGSGWVGFLFFNNNLPERNKFFYRFYRPLVKRIMKDYYRD